MENINEKNVLDSCPQVIYNYPKQEGKKQLSPDVDIIHIHACKDVFYITIQITPWDIEWIDNQTYKTLESAIDIFKKRGYDKAVELYGKTNCMELIENNTIFDKLVPGYGAASTIEGEMLRAYAKINYRFCNDGDVVGIGYGKETTGAPYAFLMDMAKMYPYDFSGLEYKLDDLRNENEDKESYRCILEEIGTDIAKGIVLKGTQLTPDRYDMLSDEYYNKAIKMFGKFDE